MSRTTKEPKKTPSQRLKAVYYILWEQDKEGFEEFEAYYDNKVEKLIVHYKQLIKE